MLRPLSRRQIQVMKLAAKGYTNEEIGKRLGIMEGTVKLHMHQILLKTGNRNRTELAIEILSKGMK